MKKKVLISIALLAMTVVGINLSRPDSTTGVFLKNAEALANNEQTNEWESNYKYCRCKNDDNGGKSCYSGNAISLRPSCGKSDIGASLDCRSNDSQCRD